MVSAQMSYPALVQAYADGVDELLMPASRQRSLAVRSYQELANEAHALLPVSDAFTDAAAMRAERGSGDERVAAQMQLLAKCLADLAVSQHLLDAAEDESHGITAQVAGLSRSAALFEVDVYLDVVRTGTLRRPRSQALRQDDAVTDGASHADLTAAIDATLTMVLDRSALNGQAAFRGLISIGVFNLAKASAIVGADIAQLLGYGEQASKLYELVYQYVGRAHETILALLGRELSRVAVDRAMTFFDSLRDGSLLGDLLERLYETQRTRSEVGKMIAASNADDTMFARAREDIDALTAQFDDIMTFVDKLLSGPKYVGLIPAATMPQAQLVMAASHAVLFTYIVLAGADFADSPRIKMLNRVPGVRDLVLAALHSKG